MTVVQSKAPPMHSTSPAAQALLEETNELFQANMALIAQAFPALYTKLVGTGKVHTELVRVGEDDWDVEFRGARFFGNGSRARAREQVEAFRENNPRFKINPVSSSSLDRFTNGMMIPLLKRSSEADITFNSENQGQKGWHLVLFGWGLGDHVFDLLEYTGAHNLLVVDANLELILHSLRTFDWHRLINDPPHRPLTITWMMDDLPPDLVAVNIRAHFRYSNLARVDGSYYFSHYPNNFLQRVRDALLSDLGQAFKGLGYIDDELKMLRNAYQNLSSDSALVLRRTPGKRHWPVFIIGSGPSLDASLPTIRANADRAIIIACGTALPPLIKAGIKPDFFAELENGEPVFDWVERVKKTFDFGETICVASDTVDGRLKSLFDRTVFFIRPGLASTPIFGGADNNEHALQLMHPTVGNTGFSFAMSTGFTEAYLFGLDLGSKNPDRHHADNSPYETGDDIAYTFRMNISRPANFGGTSMTDNIMDWARDVLEAAIIMLARGRMIYNCSDGLLIKGTTPKLPHTVALPLPRTSREAELGAILGTWAPYGRENFDAAWSAADVGAQVTQYAEELKACCVLDHPTDPVYFLQAIADLLVPETRLTCHNIYRGTIGLALITGAYYVTHAENGKQVEVAEILIEELKELIDRMTAYVLDFLRGMKETGHYDLPLS